MKSCEHGRVLGMEYTCPIAVLHSTGSHAWNWAVPTTARSSLAELSTQHALAFANIVKLRSMLMAAQ